MALGASPSLYPAPWAPAPAQAGLIKQAGSSQPPPGLRPEGAPPTVVIGAVSSPAQAPGDSCEGLGEGRAPPSGPPTLRKGQLRAALRERPAWCQDPTAPRGAAGALCPGSWGPCHTAHSPAGSPRRAQDVAACPRGPTAGQVQGSSGRGSTKDTGPRTMWTLCSPGHPGLQAGRVQDVPIPPALLAG